VALAAAGFARAAFAGAAVEPAPLGRAVLAVPTFFAEAADGAAGWPPVLVARVTESLTDLTVERTAEPSREAVDCVGVLLVVGAVALAAGAFLAARARAVVVPDAAFSATIGPSSFVAHAVDVDKWGRQ
jgi:hypothetical protein